ncbi:hypothetical protein [Streptomyces parvulus]|uniref:hypothetical protein n=1 Tax=Streptomyces parvulus TaxID=146923 RepID=UPI001CFBC5B9|nr:hypothetical protein [Streptomyces parvulus]
MRVEAAQIKILVFLLGVVFSLVVGLVAGILVVVSGSPAVGAVFKGGTAFTACMMLWLGAMGLLSRS